MMKRHWWTWITGRNGDIRDEMRQMERIDAGSRNGQGKRGGKNKGKRKEKRKGNIKRK
jgi:hypothetical protein